MSRLFFSEKYEKYFKVSSAVVVISTIRVNIGLFVHLFQKFPAHMNLAIRNDIFSVENSVQRLKTQNKLLTKVSWHSRGLGILDKYSIKDLLGGIIWWWFWDNFLEFSIKNMLWVLIRSALARQVPTMYVLMEKSEKLFQHYHKYSSLTIPLILSFFTRGTTFVTICLLFLLTKLLQRKAPLLMERTSSWWEPVLCCFSRPLFRSKIKQFWQSCLTWKCIHSP